MRILMVSPYPPLRDGIAAYAVQAVAALRSEGHEVEVLSPGPSAAHHHLDLQGPRGALALARRVRGYDKVVIQFHPDIFYPVPSPPLRHARVSLALLVAVRAARSAEVIVHEIDYRIGRRRGPDGIAARRLWRRVDRVVLHTEMERRDFIEAFGVRPERTAVVAHGAHFVRRTSMTRQDARRSLGIPDGELVFLAIGFIQPHKGFDRAVRAFDGLGAHGCSLHVVGSVRVDEPEYLAYLTELRELVAATPGAHLHDQYVSDELFDRWLVAGGGGGRSQQAGARPGITLVDEADLAAAMWRVRDRAGGPVPAPVEAWPAGGGEQLRERVQRQVVARAARRRGAPAPAGVGGRGGGAAATTAAGWASLPLRRLPPLGLPAPTSARPGVSLVKRLLRRATAWQVDPLVAQVNALREVTIQALERSAQRDREP